MADYATWADVTVAYELPMPEEHRPRIEALLTQASVRLTALVPSLPARLTAETVNPELPKGMVVEAVLRVYRNPAGVTQQSSGPFSRSLSKDAARPEIYFDPAQVTALLNSPSELSPGVGTFRVGIPAPLVTRAALDADGWYTYTPEQLQGH